MVDGDGILEMMDDDLVRDDTGTVDVTSIVEMVNNIAPGAAEW